MKAKNDSPQIEKTCCVTGHRPEKFPWNYYNILLKPQKKYRSTLKNTLRKCIENGFCFFISGGARGVDLDFAETILRLRKKFPYISLEIAIPYPKQAEYYNKKDKEKYKKVLSKADKITFVSDEYSSWCMRKRNHYMVEKSNLVLGVWNGTENGGTYQTLRYAKNLRRRILLIQLDDFL